MVVKISKGNIKTGKIPAVSLTPVKSCGNCKYCREKCYAIKSYRQYPAVRKAWDGNYNLYKRDPEGYFTGIAEYLLNSMPEFFRFHVSGDIPDQEYLDSIKELSRAFPDVKFLVFTKMFDFNYSNTPENLSIVFSMFPGMKKPTKNFPIAYAINEGDIIPDNSINCPGNCETCGVCWNLKHIDKNVYFHMH